jgi:radical SAM superfamily enzyme YgiQ (UPF0313 family)
VKITLISTYDLGRQPFGLASPAAWLRRAGHQVECADLAVTKLSESAVRNANVIAFFLPMHTATRLALPVIDRVQRLNPGARLIAYGLYAPLSADVLHEHGVDAIAGGEFEAELVKFANGESTAEISLERLEFLTPDRRGLDGPYARLQVFDNGRRGSRQVAYTEASRGCKHMCRHCPIVPVYQGNFRVVQRDVVLSDIRQQVAAGAQHVTFGDPDFFNGPTHAMRIVEELHREFPAITYDATIKIEHLLKHRDLLPHLRETGCLFVISAVESVDDRVLQKLEKNHTRRDFYEAATLMRIAGLTLQPTFIPFTPWTTIEGYRDLLRAISELDLVEHVAPVQLALRLLVTAGSRLRELPEFAHNSDWFNTDGAVETLYQRVFGLVAARTKQNVSRTEIFSEICATAGYEASLNLLPRAAIPYLDEPWYC